MNIVIFVVGLEMFGGLMFVDPYTKDRITLIGYCTRTKSFNFRLYSGKVNNVKKRS